MTAFETHNTREPSDMRTPFLTAGWFGLVMAQWQVQRRLLEPHLPRGVELDTFQGSPYVSLVGLHFRGTKVLGLAIPFHRDFVEVNLRFYVRREVGSEVRRGVVFLREFVPRFWIACIANALYCEPYAVVPMSQSVSCSEERSSWRYSWRKGGRTHILGATARGEPQAIEAGSQEEFFAERYWGYTRRSETSTAEYRVRHDPWRVWSPEEVCLDWSPRSAYGDQWGGVLEQPPESVFIAEGSPVSVSWGGRLTQRGR